MGYRTRYTLTWEATAAWKDLPGCPHAPPAEADYCSRCGQPNKVRTLDAAVAAYLVDGDQEGDSVMSFAISPNGKSRESCSWPDCQTDIVRMSREIQGVIFHLAGEGEESGDVWDLFVLNGNAQRFQAQLTRACAPAAWRGKAEVPAESDEGRIRRAFARASPIAQRMELAQLLVDVRAEERARWRQIFIVHALQAQRESQANAGGSSVVQRSLVQAMNLRWELLSEIAGILEANRPVMAAALDEDLQERLPKEPRQ